MKYNKLYFNIPLLPSPLLQKILIQENEKSLYKGIWSPPPPPKYWN